MPHYLQFMQLYSPGQTNSRDSVHIILKNYLLHIIFINYTLTARQEHEGVAADFASVTNNRLMIDLSKHSSTTIPYTIILEIDAVCVSCF